MELDAKKIKIVQDILGLEDSKVLTEIEVILSAKNSRGAYQNSLYFMSKEDLESRVEESMSDFKAGRVKSSEELLKKYDK
jgi:hypothetical protein